MFWIQSWETCVWEYAADALGSGGSELALSVGRRVAG